MAEWAYRLRYKYREVKKGVYNNRHKGKDIVAYWQKEFLPVLDCLKHFIFKWEVDTNGNPVMIISQDLANSQKPIV